MTLSTTGAIYLENNVTTYNATGTSYGGSTFDTGSASVAYHGVVAFQASILDRSSNNEVYTMIIEGSTTSNFSGAKHDLGSWSLAVLGQQDVIQFTNVYDGVVYRYIRLKITISGTTPSLKLQSFIKPIGALDTYTTSELITIQATLAQNSFEVFSNFRGWIAGTVNGGVNSDGRYPLSDGMGSTVYVKCPAQIISDSAPLSIEDMTALSSLEATDKFIVSRANGAFQSVTVQKIMDVGHSPAFVSSLPVQAASAAISPTVVGLIGTDLKQLNMHLFASRRTADLVDIQTLVGTELIPCLTAGAEDKRAALTEIHKLFTGIINPKLPPYNCKGDLREARAATSTAGSNIVDITEPMFRASDVGKLIYLSNAAASNGPYESVITEFVSTTRVKMSTNAVVTRNANQYCMWGTDDTAGLQAAINATASPGTFTYGGIVELPPGMYLVGPINYIARAGLIGFGPRTSVLVRKPTSTTPALLTNLNANVDFPNIQNIGLYGAQYMQRWGYGNRGFVFSSQNGSVSMPQVDPYPFFAHIHIWSCSFDGMYTYGRHSGTQLAVESMNNWGYGWQCQSYDCNAMNFLAIANSYNGYASEGANNNLANAKISYNGAGGWNDSTRANCRESGAGNSYSNMRLQESVGANLYITGQWNEWDNLGIDDTGCVFKAHTGQTAPTVRAAVHFAANTATDNLVKFKAGRAVHSTSNYMTHAVYYSGDASENVVQGRVRSGTPAANAGGTVYAPIGYNSSGGLGVSNIGTLNGVDIHTL